jgi:GNAT superfamily N-acetyltransferase
MAALTRSPRPGTRPPAVGEGVAIASLWRELWDAHEDWGGYPGTRDPGVYAQLGRRLDDEARARAGRPILGGHLHLVASLGHEPCGQVEGWLEQNGSGASGEPRTCEVRSLIVAARARRLGVGRALLDGIEDAVRSHFRGAPCILAAEVLEPNPAHDFYSRVGFSPVAWSAHIDVVDLPASRHAARGMTARFAVPDDALALAHLEVILGARRRAAGDERFPLPPRIDVVLLGAIAARVAEDGAALSPDHATIVVTDREGVVRASASVQVQTLEPPFLPLRRGLVGRIAVDPAGPVPALVAPLLELGSRFAASRGAARVEFLDLTAPGTPLHDSVLALGARPWSRVVVRSA